MHTNTTVNRGNVARLEQIVDLAARGMKRLTMDMAIPCGRAGGHSPRKDGTMAPRALRHAAPSRRRRRPR